jgi:hypothetical protein
MWASHLLSHRTAAPKFHVRPQSKDLSAVSAGDAAEFVAGVAISQRASQFGDRSQAGEAAVFSAARSPPRAQKLGLLAIGSSSAR